MSSGRQEGAEECRKAPLLGGFQCSPAGRGRRRLTWIEIGSVAGATASIPSAALRSSRLSIVGSGQGSVSPRDILGELPSLVAAISKGSFEVETRSIPLRDVESA
ncbi:hypothetical protein B7R22_05125 [Subtercola boreus]|uniref:Uncharacterized protein n=1 Tax=Subtercola boreus TaxID=120213 RepID=A0A3E0W345_9MICO|nr:hypothetical protein [Subtercola boreus]RFA15988.1 hypothetical protein B7R22_05125 [Subtercola boreus]